MNGFLFAEGLLLPKVFFDVLLQNICLTLLLGGGSGKVESSSVAVLGNVLFFSNSFCLFVGVKHVSSIVRGPLVDAFVAVAFMFCPLVLELLPLSNAFVVAAAAFFFVFVIIFYIFFF